MDEYIKRESIFPNGVFYVNEDNQMTSLDELIDRIHSLPAADVVEVRHGEWVYHSTDDNDMVILQCSVCGRKQYGTSNYCPNCGAKMDGKGE